MAKEKLWGYIDKDGEYVVEPKFNGADNFNEGLAVVKLYWPRG